MKAFNRQVEKDNQFKIRCQRNPSKPACWISILVNTVGQIKGRKVAMICNCHGTSKEVTF